MPKKLKVVSIFSTLDGEVTCGGPGGWTTFVRTAGCPLRCWKSTGLCDSPHTLDFNFPHPEYEIEEVVRRIRDAGIHRVTISGGEPLSQQDEVLDLTKRLRDEDYVVTLETSGSLSVFEATKVFTSVIADVKPPSTEMAKKNYEPNMGYLRRQDFAKFVLSDAADYDWSLAYLDSYPTKAQVAFGVKFGGELTNAKLVEMLRKDALWGIKLNFQTHKYIWPPEQLPVLTTLKGLDYDYYVKKEV